MRQLGSWAPRAGLGFVRACVVAAVTMLVPAVWAADVALGIWWAGNPWSWAVPFVLACVSTLALSRPVCRMVRFLVARWTATVIPAGYRQAGQVTRMSIGHWWNGFSYERTRRDALLDQQWRLWWSDPANRRDLRFAVIAPFTAGVIASLPVAAWSRQPSGSASQSPPRASSERSAWWWPSPRPRTPGGPSSQWPSASYARRPRWRWRTRWTS
jgi:hypothetical protein